MESKKMSLETQGGGPGNSKVYSYARNIGISSPEFEEVKSALEAKQKLEIKLKFGPLMELELRGGRIYIKNTPAEVVNADAAAMKGALLHQSAWHKLYLVLGSPVSQTTTTAFFEKGGAAYACDLASDVVTDRVCGGLANLDTTALVLATRRPPIVWRAESSIGAHSLFLAQAANE